VRDTYIFHFVVFLCALLYGWTPELLGPVAEKPIGSIRKNNSGHVFYFFEKCDIHVQVSQFLLEVRHFELWTPNVQHLGRKSITIKF